MSAGDRHKRFDFDALTARQRYKLLIGTVVPRPIAFVTTVDEHGAVNAAPFSFFNCLTADPPIVVIGVENHADMTFKDTARNVRVTEEFTVNIVDDAIMAAMNTCAVAFPSDVDELERAGLTAVPGALVGCPRIAESPASLECERHMTIELGRSREIILGRVVAAFIRDDIVDETTHHVDQAGLDAVGRMGGHGYARTRDYFDLQTPSVAEWEKEHQRQGGEGPAEAGIDTQRPPDEAEPG